MDPNLAPTNIREQKKRHTAELLKAIEHGAPIPLETKLAFGLTSAAHERVLVNAVKEQRLTEAELETCCMNGKALTTKLAQAPAQLALTFWTIDDFYRRHQADDVMVRINEVHQIKTKHGGFAINVANAIELWRAETLLSKEPETIAWLDRTIKQGSVLFDVGANVGVFTLYAAHIMPSVSVLAFEPEPLNFARLNQNVQANAKLAKNIICYPIALHQSAAVSKFFTATFATGKAENWSERDNEDRTFAAHAVGCVMYALDELIPLGSLPAPSHLKIDVDGPELAILHGATKCLAQPTLEHVLVELSESDLVAATALLDQFGFHRVERHVHQVIDGVPHGNVIFAR